MRDAMVMVMVSLCPSHVAGCTKYKVHDTRQTKDTITYWPTPDRRRQFMATRPRHPLSLLPMCKTLIVPMFSDI